MRSRRPKAGAAGERIVPAAGQQFEDAPPAGQDTAQFQTEPPGHLGDQWRAGFQQRGTAPRLPLDQPAQGGVGLTRAHRPLDGRFIQAGGPQFIERDVEPSARPVDGHVLKKIDQLQGRADGIGRREQRLATATEQSQHQATDWRRRARAIVLQGGEIGVAGHAHILPEGREQGPAFIAGLRLGGQVGHQRRHQRVPGSRFVECVLEPGEFGQALLRRVLAFIGDVVGITGESV